MQTNQQSSNAQSGGSGNGNSNGKSQLGSGYSGATRSLNNKDSSSRTGNTGTTML